jgi:arylsulfatase A-like enzyme
MNAETNQTTINKKPNIILINCDDLGYGDLHCYGSQDHKTPVLDQLAENGVKFTSFYMASPVCSPSRGAMMTGCYPKRIGFGSFNGKWVLFPGDGVGLNPNEHTLARGLKEEGYQTMIVGKWHCGDQPEFLPTRHGFDHYYGIPYSNDMGKQIGRENYPPLPLLCDEEVLQAQPDQTSLTERYVEQCVRFIRGNKEQPFFLYLAHMYVHLPLYVPERFLKESPNPYAAAVACIDWATGVLIDELKRLGLTENTLVIFTSDNGSRNDYGTSNGLLRGKKGTTWEGGMRVPCIMSWPNKIPAGHVCNELVTSMDLLPTLTHLAGGEIPSERIIDGKDISSLMFSHEGAASPHQAFFYYMRDSLEAVRVGNWKLHIRKNKEAIYELYDLEKDISESHNLFEQNPEVVAELMRLIEACRVDLGDEATGVEGNNCRPIGRVTAPQTLTQYDPEHPYIIAMYDIKDAG